MHMLPRVRELHERYLDVLSVVGVHAGKFTTERRTDRIAEACDRLGVIHAVVNDRQFRVWRDYDVRAWPTIALVDPRGRLVTTVSGESEVDALASQIDRIVAEARAAGTLVAGPDPFPARITRHEGTLRFPTRAMIARDRLWVADMGHGRVLECHWDAGAFAATVVADHRGFEEPRGLAQLGERMFVADRAGQAVWRLDPEEPRRVAGTGRLGAWTIVPGQASETDIRSPWGLAARGGLLGIAMAGSHQLWELEMESGEMSLLTGTGREDIGDGPLARATLAQPTGLTSLHDGTLALADCESSAVRLAGSDTVRTLVGTDLFKFGDRPGIGDEALLQHCEDVAVTTLGLAVADTYNDRIKMIDPATRDCVPWPGEAGERGSVREPGGVWSDGSTLLVSDTGNHRVVSVGSEGTLTEVSFL